MANLIDVLAYYECECGFSFVDQYAKDEELPLKVECPACETPGVNE
ncbi:hypothetical protein AB8O64_29985 [Streptomyces sp. QH1-20]